VGASEVRDMKFLFSKGYDDKIKFPQTWEPHVKHIFVFNGVYQDIYDVVVEEGINGLKRKIF